MCATGPISDSARRDGCGPNIRHNPRLSLPLTGQIRVGRTSGVCVHRILAAVSAFIALAVALPAEAACGRYDDTNPCEIRNGHYRIVLPEGDAPHPTVLYLYGSLGNSGDLINNRGFVEAFTSRGYAVIVPAGLDLQYVSGTGSGWFLRNSRAPKKRDDTKFVSEVLTDAELRHRIDRRKVLIAGMSNGGFLAWEIACHAPDLAAAYAPVGAGYLGEMPTQCVKPVRVLHTHGRSDEIVTHDGRGDRRVSGGARIMLLDKTMETIARSNGCVRAAAPQRFLIYDRTTWQGCPRGGSVDLLMHDGGHTIPPSWFDYVIEWFESPGNIATARGGGIARFRTAGDRGGRFRSSGGGSTRFKRVSD